LVRKFLYTIVFLVVLAIGAALALRVWGGRLEQIAFVPTTAYEEQGALAGNAYADTSMWLSHPRFTATSDPSRWQPDGATKIENPPRFAVFFVHPTSYLERTHWNAPLDDRQSKSRARTFLRGLASAFDPATEIWAPRYRQATFGAFLTDDPAGTRAIDAAYRDVAQAFDEFLAKYFPEGNRIDAFVMYGYTVTQTLVHVLKACGDNLTRENVMKQAASIKDLELGGMLPGIKINTSATDFAPISAVQLVRFKGEAWDRFGNIIEADVTN